MTDLVVVKVITMESSRDGRRYLRLALADPDGKCYYRNLIPWSSTYSAELRSFLSNEKITLLGERTTDLTIIGRLVLGCRISANIHKVGSFTLVEVVSVYDG